MLGGRLLNDFTGLLIWILWVWGAFLFQHVQLYCGVMNLRDGKMNTVYIERITTDWYICLKWYKEHCNENEKSYIGKNSLKWNKEPSVHLRNFQHIIMNLPGGTCLHLPQIFGTEFSQRITNRNWHSTGQIKIYCSEESSQS